MYLLLGDAGFFFPILYFALFYRITSTYVLRHFLPSRPTRTPFFSFPFLSIQRPVLTRKSFQTRTPEPRLSQFNPNPTSHLDRQNPFDRKRNKTTVVSTTTTTTTTNPPLFPPPDSTQTKQKPQYPNRKNPNMFLIRANWSGENLAQLRSCGGGYVSLFSSSLSYQHDQLN